MLPQAKKPEVPEGPLTGGQLAAIPILATGGLKKDAAAAADVTPQTVSVWFGQPQFQAALEAARQELSVSARATLKEATDAAVRAILDLLHSDSDATRLKAACYVLDRVLVMGGTATDESEDARPKQVDMHKLMEAIGA